MAELLTEWDERIWVWRFRHYSIVARALGEDTIGTQGTPVQVLGKLIAQRQIPKLWDVAAGSSSCSTPSGRAAPPNDRQPSGAEHSPGAVDPSTAPGESGEWGHSPLTRWDEFPRPKLTVRRIWHIDRSK